MRILVEPKVTAGLDRGGEDLELTFTAFHDGDTPPISEPCEVLLCVDDDQNGCSVEQVADEIKDTNESFLANARVRYRTDYYEFEWEGDGVAALALQVYDKSNRVTVEQFFRNSSNWRFCHQPGESPRLVCSVDAYVDGNAD